MAEPATVYLKEPVAPGPTPKAYHSGYISAHDAQGIVMHARDDWRGDSVFFPAHLILRIEYNTGWR